MAATFLALGCCIAAAVLVFSLTTANRCPLGPHTRHAPEGAQRVWGVGLTKSEAEDLLDWLEANGRKGQLTFASGQGFTVL